MKKLTKLFVYVPLTVFAFTQNIFGFTYADDSFDPEFPSVLSWMNSNNLTKYTTESSFRPYDTLTREQAAKFFAEFTKNVLGKKVDTSTSCTFSDLNYADSTLRDSIIEACNLGLVKGSDGKFWSKASFTKAQAIAVLVRAISGPQDENVYPWWNNYFIKARELGITSETNSMALDRNVLRGEIALMLNRASKLNLTTTTNTNNNSSNSSNDLTDLLSGLLNGNNGSSTNTNTSTSNGNTTNTSNTNNGSTTVVSTSYGLELSLNPSSASPQLIPSIGTVVFGKFDLRAGSSDVTLNSIKLYREGLGQRNDISRVWMEKDGVRVTSRQTVGSDNSVILTFSPALVIPANSLQTLAIVASLNGNSSNSQHRFSITSVNDISASSTSIGGSYPISTNYMTTSSYQVSSVMFSTGGSSSNYNVGNTNVELGQFRLQNNAGSDTDVIFKSITLRNEGNGDLTKNLTNLGIYRAGTLVSTNYKVDGRYVTFYINDDRIAFGRQETYYIRGNIVGVDNTSGDNYQFSLRYSDDIAVLEGGTLFPTRIFGVDSNVMLGNYSINGGDIVLSKSTNYTSSQTVSPGSNDVVLLSANLSSSQAINLGDMTVSLNNAYNYSGTLSDLAQSFTVLKLKVGNNIVSTYTPGSSSSNTFMFEGTFNVPGDSTVQILGNMRSNAYGRFLINEISYNNFATREYSYNGNTIQQNQFVGSVGGIVTSVGAADITWNRNDGISNQNIVVGARDRTLMQFVARANDVSDITVTKLKFLPGAATSVTFNNSYVTNLRLYANDQLISTKNMSAGNADFNDINVRIAKNSDITFRVVGDFSTAVGLGQTFQLSLSGSGLIEARDANSVYINEIPQINGPVYTFTDAGAATVGSNSSTPTSRLITPTSTETEIAKYTISSNDDSLRLTDLYLYNQGTADLSSRLRSISLYDSNGNKLAGGSILGNSVVAFSLGSTSPFIVPKNTSNSVISIRASFNDITSSDSNLTTVKLAVGVGSSGISTVDGTVNGVRLVSESIGNTVNNVNVSNATSNTHLIVRSKPTVTISSTATMSTHTFTVTADSNNRIMLTGLTLNVSNPSGGPQDYTLYKDSESVGNAVANGSFNNGTLTMDFPQGVEISAGSSRTFVLVLSNSAGTPQVNAKRIVRVTDMKYMDIMDMGNNVLIPSVSTYANVGLPSAESTYSY